MVEYNYKKWTIAHGERGEFTMKSTWKMARPSFSIEIQPPLSYKEEAIPSKVVARLEHMRREQARALQDLMDEYALHFSVSQLEELGKMIDWQKRYSAIYYQRAQAVIYFSASDDTARAIEPIILSYNKIMARLQSELSHYSGEERIEALLHLASWLADAPHRFALRLLQFEIDVLEDNPPKGKRGYMEKEGNSIEAVPFFYS